MKKITHCAVIVVSIFLMSGIADANKFTLVNKCKSSLRATTRYAGPLLMSEHKGCNVPYAWGGTSQSCQNPWGTSEVTIYDDMGRDMGTWRHLAQSMAGWEGQDRELICKLERGVCICEGAQWRRITRKGNDRNCAQVNPPVRAFSETVSMRLSSPPYTSAT